MTFDFSNLVSVQKRVFAPILFPHVNYYPRVSFLFVKTKSSNRSPSPPSLNSKPFRSQIHSTILLIPKPKTHQRLSPWTLDRSSNRTVASSGAPPPTQSLTQRRKQTSSTENANRSRDSIRGSRARPQNDFPFWQQNWFLGLLFLMAMVFFALAVFLFLGLNLDESSPSSASAASSETVEVRIQLFNFLIL